MSYVETFALPIEIASAFDLNNLISLQPTEQHEIFIFGKQTKIPRYQQAYGKDYKFSNTVSKALPIPDIFNNLISYFNTRYNVNFNMMLVNWYPNGSYYIGMHSDDEKQIIPNTPIVTVSFGATRKFVIECKTSKQKQTYLVKNNDVLVMCGEFQKTHKHGLPKMAKVKDPRVSITLRCFY